MFQPSRSHQATGLLVYLWLAAIFAQYVDEELPGQQGRIFVSYYNALHRTVGVFLVCRAFLLDFKEFRECGSERAPSHAAGA